MMLSLPLETLSPEMVTELTLTVELSSTVTSTEATLEPTLALTLAVPACTAYTTPAPETAIAALSDHQVALSEVLAPTR